MRKTKTIAISADNRDKGKTFLITEMSARRAEEWVVRAFLGMQQAGVQVSDEAREFGAAAVISEGFGALLQINPKDAIPLLDEMMECVTVVPDPRKLNQETQTPIARALIDRGDDGDDIEEVTTRFMLRAEVIELHTGFPVADALSTLGAAAKRRMGSSDTPTSPNTSEPSSQAA